jgi:hypothetical protein
MNITAALYRAAHGYQGGMAKLAQFVGCSEFGLQHKVSPSYLGAHCSPDELVTICEVTQDLGPLQAMAMRLGQLVIPLPTAAGVKGDVAVKLAATCQSFGELITEYSTSLADGRVTQNELRRIEREGAELNADVHALLAHASAQVEAAKPAAHRMRVAS